MYTQAVAIGCLGWFVLLAVVATIGTVQIFRHFSRPPRNPISSRLDLDHVPHVTIIRPCKGLEPFLYDCLAATFHQDYPRNLLSIRFCVSSRSDVAYPILQQLVKDYPEYDTRVFVEDEDPIVQGQGGGHFGPNPKIRNMSRAYREAKGDIVWILDCNIWVGCGALGRMVDKLCGFTTLSNTGSKAQTQNPYKLVAHLPVCVDVDKLIEDDSRHRSTSASASDDPSTVPFVSSSTTFPLSSSSSTSLTGNKLDVSFLSTAHAKMYIAINSVSIAPCINGKSTMFRKSHLNHLTSNQGIDYFSHNICEDHLIGDLLWKSHIPATLGFAGSTREELQRSNAKGLDYWNHGLAMGDLAIQPVARMSITSYIARRVRWLRVRKFTVTLATLVEPGTESLVCCMIGAYGVTTFMGTNVLFGASWIATIFWFVLMVICWCMVDWFVSGVIQGMGCVETKGAESTSSIGRSVVVVPSFARPIERRFGEWLVAWIGRESLALPIWAWAFWGGTTVTWREKRFWVGMDMRVHEVAERGDLKKEELRDEKKSYSGVGVGAEGTNQDVNGSNGHRGLVLGHQERAVAWKGGKAD